MEFIKGASIDISQLFKSNQSKKPSIQNKMDEMTYSISATGVNYECSKCHVNSTHFATFCLHLQRFHKLPMIFKCKQCQKAAVQNKIDEAEFKGMAILVVEFQALCREIYIYIE